MKAITAAFLAVGLLAVAPLTAQVVDELSRRKALERYRAGYELLVAERFEQAADEFRGSIELDPMLALAHYGLGQAYMGLKRYVSAIQAFTGCRDVYRRIADLRQKDSALSIRLQTDEINELRDALARAQTGRLQLNAGTVFRLEQRLEELEVLRRGRNFSEPFQVPAEVSLALGSAFYRNGNRDEAERLWTEAVTSNPKLGEAWNNLAVIHMGNGRKQDAEEAVRKAERAGFRVNPRLKDDIKRMKDG